MTNEHSEKEVLFVPSEELSEASKKEIESAVKKIVEEYGETLRLLGKDD